MPPEIHLDTITPPTGVKTVTTTETISAPAGSGGLMGRFATFGNMTGIGLIFVMFAFGGYFLITNFTSVLKDKIADDKEERIYQRTIHDRDMLLLTNGMTKNSENTAALIQEMTRRAESMDKDIKTRQEAFERRTEQQHTEIKELHDIIIKGMKP